MPIREYRCRRCGEEFEEIQLFSDPDFSKCKFCGGKVDKVFSRNVSAHFKGRGFYETDNRDREYKNAYAKERGIDEDAIP